MSVLSPVKTHCGLVTPYGDTVTQIWDNIVSGNGFLPEGTEPLPKPMLTYHQFQASDLI